MPTNSTSQRAIKDNRFLAKLLHHRRFFVVLGQAIVVLALLAVLYYQLLDRKDVTLKELYRLFLSRISVQRLPVLIGVVLLMPINWFIETQKWVILLHPIQQLRFFAALKIVLIGVTGSLFTPNRIGEYGGRLLLLESQKRYQAVYATLLGACSQWIVLILLGWWALLFAFYQHWLPLSPSWFCYLFWGGLVGSILLLAAYFNLKRLLYWIVTWKWIAKWTAPLQHTPFIYYHHKLLWTALSYALLRSLTYSIQYVGLLYFFGYSEEGIVMLIGVLIVYLLQTGIPLPPSTGLLARGNLALFIFGNLQPNAWSSSILAATFSLWLLNVILPALWGAWFVVRLGKTTNNEKKLEGTKEINKN